MRILYFVLVACFCYSQVNADLTERPANTAVIAGAGTTVTLRCVSHASPPIVRVMWTEYATSGAGSILSDNRGVVPSHPNAGRYAITGNPVLNEFHLTISNVVREDGGRYLCSDALAFPPNTYRGFVELVVFASEPTCRDYAPNSAGLVYEHREYNGECSVDYTGNLVPNKRWYGREGSFYTNGTQPPGHVWSYISFTPDRTFEGLFYYCRTNFTEPQNGITDSATNAPDFEHTFEGSSLTVVWTPTDMTVTPIKAFYEVGDVLTCFADSKPESSYQWTNMRILYDYPPGHSFTVTADLLGTTQIMRCRAVTNIGGDIFTGDLFHNVTILALTTVLSTTTAPTTTPAASSQCDNPTGRWMSTNPSALVCIDVDSKGNLYTLIRNSTDLFFATGRGKTVMEDYSHIGFTCLWPTSLSGTAGFTGECHKCFGNEVILMSGMSRNKYNSEECGESVGTQLTSLYVFTRAGPACLGMTVDEVRTNQPWILDKMGIKAKKIVPVYQKV